ncbi:hypothetical protein [Streptomyces cyslabdanicus]|uniref:hypothetical protein n=1 Tax=Streptomyces cyslabdanicus TaxID=1470456 RepID=UPI0040446371
MTGVTVYVVLVVVIAALLCGHHGEDFPPILTALRRRQHVFSHLLTATLATATLAVSAGWCWGHRTARIRHVPIGATAAHDETALSAHDRATFDDLVAGLDHPDHPGSTT